EGMIELRRSGSESVRNRAQGVYRAEFTACVTVEIAGTEALGVSAQVEGAVAKLWAIVSRRGRRCVFSAKAKWRVGHLNVLISSMEARFVAVTVAMCER